MGDHQEQSHGHDADDEAHADVLGAGLVHLIGHEAADGAAHHFQAVLVDDAVGTHRGGGQQVDVVQEGDEVGQAAVDAVDHEAVQSNGPDVHALEGLHHAAEGSGGLVQLLAVGAHALLVVGNEDQAQDARRDGGAGQEDQTGAQGTRALAHGSEDGQRGARDDHVHDAAAHFQETKHTALGLLVAQKADGLEQNGPVSNLSQNGDHAEGCQETPVGREGGQVEAHQTDADQASADHVLLAEHVADVDTGDQADGLHDAVGAHGAADLGIGQAHELLHGNVEHILHAAQLEGDAAGQGEDAEGEPAVRSRLHHGGLGLVAHGKFLLKTLSLHIFVFAANALAAEYRFCLRGHRPCGRPSWEQSQYTCGFL